MKNKYKFEWMKYSEGKFIPVTLDNTLRYKYDLKNRKMVKSFSFFEALLDAEIREYALPDSNDDMN